MLHILKVFIAAGVITGTSWLASKKPGLAGFLLALPISTLIALAFNYAEFQDSTKTVAFARSVLVGIPLSLTFFIPFLISDKLKISFWTLYMLGIFLLGLTYFIHAYFMAD